MPHLGATVVEVHGAVLVDVHQRAGLVQVHQGEGDAELHRRERKPLLQRLRARVERCDRASALAVAARALQRLDERAQRLGLVHGLAVGRDVAAGAIEVGVAYVERIAARGPGDAVHHVLDRQHALRAAEAAEGGVRDGVGEEPARIDAHRREVV